MGTLEVTLLFGAAVLVSSVIAQVLPKVSPPLVQIAMGLILALAFTSKVDVSINPEFFLFLFVAPLLYNDAREADKFGLWQNRGRILGLAIGLVVVIMVAVGLIVHAIIPQIPLAAAFALGAALGPTDAVAVASLKKVAKLTPKESSLLSGEALINDASGVVTFKFAVAAAVVGTTSIFDASLEFVVSFFGGIALGLVVAGALHWVQKKVRESGIESITFNVLLDVMMPFFIYLLSERIGVSGILAVVAAGLLISSFNDRIIGPTNARLSIVTSSVWQVLAFALNGIVFVILGTKLPLAMSGLLTEEGVSNFMLLGYVLLITAIITLVRFAWVSLSEFRTNRKQVEYHKQSRRALLRSAAVTTVGGPKGAVTLSIILSLPFLIASGDAFPARDLLIFMASGVILCTLLMANFLLPVLAPAEGRGEHKKAHAKAVDTPEHIDACKIEIFNRVISTLLESKTKENSRAIHAVVRAYNQRINRIRTNSDIDSSDVVRLRLKVLEVERAELIKMHNEKSFSDTDIARGILRIERLRNFLTHEHENLHIFALAIKHLPTTCKVLANTFYMGFRRVVGLAPSETKKQIWVRCEEAAIEYLTSLLVDNADISDEGGGAGGDSSGSNTNNEPPIPQDTIKEMLNLYQTAAHAATGTMQFNVTTYTKTTQKMREIEQQAYQIELDEIANMLEEGEITKSTANKLRDNVYLMLIDNSDEI